MKSSISSSLRFPSSEINSCSFKYSTWLARVSMIMQCYMIKHRWLRKFSKIRVMPHTLINIQAVRWNPPIRLAGEEQSRVKPDCETLVKNNSKNKHIPTFPPHVPRHNMNFYKVMHSQVKFMKYTLQIACGLGGRGKFTSSKECSSGS